MGIFFPDSIEKATVQFLKDAEITRKKTDAVLEQATELVKELRAELEWVRQVREKLKEL